MIVIDREAQLVHRFCLNIDGGKFIHEVGLHEQDLSIQFLLRNSFVHSNNIIEITLIEHETSLNRYIKLKKN